MELARLLYISEATRPIGPAELAGIVRTSQQNNATKGITGLLVCAGGQFFQALEGDPLRVSALYNHIRADPRHTNAVRLQFKPIGTRLFAEWGMELVHADHAGPIDQDRMAKALIRLRLGNGLAADEVDVLLREFRS
ncbi:MAG TPA: BLUF domain-containing protein, partial [Humisphaera sp.]